MVIPDAVVPIPADVNSFDLSVVSILEYDGYPENATYVFLSESINVF